jgi:hypothetical protein
VLCFKEGRVVLEDLRDELHGILDVIFETSQSKLVDRPKMLELL